MQANAVLAGAGAAQAQGAIHQLLIQGFSGFPLLWVIGVDQIAEVEIAVAHMPN